MSGSNQPPPTTTAYVQAWRAWTADSRRRGEVTRQAAFTMYESMWMAMAEWAQLRVPEPLDLTATDLSAYLHERGRHETLSPRYAWRMARLTERVLALRARTLQRPANDAVAHLLERRPDIKFANASHRDALPEVITPTDASKVLRLLRQQRRPWSPAQAATHWQSVRNLTAVVLQLGAGLGPGDVRALEIPHIRRQDEVIVLQLPANGNSPSRPARLRPWVAQALDQWLELRLYLRIPGNMVFPSTRSTGRAWGKVAFHEAVKRVLAEADCRESEGGAYRLRHTYAIRELRRGVTPAHIAAHLGVSDPDVMDRYQRLWDELMDGTPGGMQSEVQ